MKKVLFLLIILILFTQCGKKAKQDKESTEENVNVQQNKLNAKKEIDFDSMKKIIDNSEKMDMDVFFAISVLHKYNITKHAEEVENLAEEEQKKFFEQKKKDFFNSIKYSEAEYISFMENNIERLNEYQNEHPAIRDYLTTIN
jgi:hypothetical protein